MITATTASAAASGASHGSIRRPGGDPDAAARTAQAAPRRNPQLAEQVRLHARGLGAESFAQPGLEVGHRCGLSRSRASSARPRDVVDRTVLGLIRSVAAISAASRSA